MKILFLILLTFSLFLNLQYFIHLRNDNTVIEVMDGDMFQLKSGEGVKLLGVDAPEYDRSGGSESTEKLTSLIWGKVVRIFDCVIKGNIDVATYEKFYHLPSCSHYDQIVIEKDRGEGYFCTEEEAIAAGFKKAGGCP